MTRSLSVALSTVLAFVGCTGDVRTGDELERSSDALVCAWPTMSLFPVRGAHNIGYDRASCGTGTCATSCPDVHANSDWGGSHHGIDVFAHDRAELQAVTDATVVAVGVVSSTSGIRVRIRDACGWEYYYGHLHSAVVRVGQRVSAGELIGYMGRTGTASVHLHFNVSPDGRYSSDIDPFGLLHGTSATACGPAAPPPPPPPAPSPVAGCGVLEPGQSLSPGQAVTSCDGRFVFAHQTDGNVVLYQYGVALWNTATHGHGTSTLAMQLDGNLVLYDVYGTPLWHTHTYGHDGAALVVQDDGNVVLYQGATALWNTQTCCR